MAVEALAMERRKRAYRVSIEPPLERASGGFSSNALYGRRS
jgi:hypothetical protein